MTMETPVTQESQLSAKWLKRFELLDQFNAINRNRTDILRDKAFRALPWKKRFLITTNLWAFLFGPLYYFAKKMHRKGFVILGIASLWSAMLTVIEYQFSLTLPAFCFSILPSVICASYANFDYYLKKEIGQIMWARAPFWLHTTSGVAIFTLLGIGINIWAIQDVMQHEYYTYDAQHAFITETVRCGDSIIHVTTGEYRFNSKESICDLLQE
ncbi:DUF2628 domain-containing protein [Vibrio tritonius]|uniref:DUF2628 domain-containing protein n=1 Tax=Vibrio tritonius TaxID=1435069 RepID=UPI00315D011F